MLAGQPQLPPVLPQHTFRWGHPTDQVFVQEDRTAIVNTDIHSTARMECMCREWIVLGPAARWAQRTAPLTWTHGINTMKPLTPSSCWDYNGAFAASQSDANAMCTLQFNFLPTQCSFCNSKPNILPDTKSEDYHFSCHRAPQLSRDVPADTGYSINVPCLRKR